MAPPRRQSPPTALPRRPPSGVSGTPRTPSTCSRSPAPRSPSAPPPWPPGSSPSSPSGASSAGAAAVTTDRAAGRQRRTAMIDLSRGHAERLDAADPLAGFRDEFVDADPDLIYLDGN